jgi:hypothetical protein
VIERDVVDGRTDWFVWFVGFECDVEERRLGVLFE